jgi:membrane fusion protein (multidrug efflux system)
MNETRPISVPDDMVAARQQRRRSVNRVIRRLILLIVVPILIVVIAIAGWLQTGGVSSTDDAYVRADKIAIVPRVSGRITEVAVTENEPVKPGQLLFRIDPQPYELAVQRTAAEVNAARLDIDSLKSAYHARQSELKAARDSQDYWTKEYNRQHELVNNHDVSVSKYEQVHNFMDMARFMADATEQQVDQTLKALGGDVDKPTDEHPKVKAAIAAHDRAVLELSYTDVTAPGHAYVARENLQPGAWAQAGMPVFDVISTDDVRVEANFKETDLTDVRPGQPASVTVDTYPGHAFKGHVASIAAATGAEFALLPAQNASGNWVKVVQRIPVRIAIDQQPGDPELRSGMSANVDITTGGKHHLSDLLPGFLTSKSEKK